MEIEGKRRKKAESKIAQKRKKALKEAGLTM